MKCFGVGYFANEPELVVTDNSKQCDFTLAVKERRRKDGKTSEITNFFNFVVWAEAAELIYKHKHKGDAIYFEAVPRDENRDGKVTFRITDFQFLNLKKKHRETQDTSSERV